MKKQKKHSKPKDMEVVYTTDADDYISLISAGIIREGLKLDKKRKPKYIV